MPGVTVPGSSGLDAYACPDFAEAVATRLVSKMPAPAALLDRARAAMGRMRAEHLGGALGRRIEPTDCKGTRKILILTDSLRARGPMAAAASVARDARFFLRDGTACKGRDVGAVRPGAGAVDVWSLLESADEVWTDGAPLGFLALIGERPVRCFAAGFHSGWGLTDDAPGVPRKGTASLADVFAAAMLSVARYRDPFGSRPIELEQAFDILAEWRRHDEANRDVAVCVGMSVWKRRRMREMFRSSTGEPIFVRHATSAVRAAARRRGSIAVWATREPPGLTVQAAAANVPVIRVEDGFLRSVGLGADFVPALSVIADRRGIYYDPSTRSDFLKLAQTAEFPPRMLERARNLMRIMVERRITKYNIGAPLPMLEAAGRRSLFVPGQVEDDRSVLTAGAGITSNLELLRRIRAANPDSVILYKPHPDVDAGHRLGAVPDEEALRFADRIVRGVSSADLITAVDEVHTLTSLAGFEALLRARPVTVYGQPFYSGWGLTTDMAPAAPGRTRKLTLEQLVAVTLILYPRYLDPVTRLACGPEVVIDRLGQPELWRPGLLVQARRLHGTCMTLLRRSRGGSRRRIVQPG